MFIRDGSLYFSGEGGWAISKKDPAQQKLKKYHARGVTRKKLSKCFYYHYFDFFFMLKKNLAQAIAHQKNYAHPKCEKKISCPRKFPTLTSHLEENKGIRVHRLMM